MFWTRCPGGNHGDRPSDISPPGTSSPPGSPDSGGDWAQNTGYRTARSGHTTQSCCWRNDWRGQEQGILLLNMHTDTEEESE